jgi:hypothetical protein
VGVSAAEGGSGIRPIVLAVVGVLVRLILFLAARRRRRRSAEA